MLGVNSTLFGFSAWHLGRKIKADYMKARTDIEHGTIQRSYCIW